MLGFESFCEANRNGKPYGPSGEEHKGDEPSEPGGEDLEVEDLPEHVLEGAMLQSTLVDKAMELDHLGGTHGGNRKPTPFM